MNLSIVIVNWNTRQLLLDALESIYNAPPSFPFEVFVIDNNSKDESAEAVAKHFPKVVLIANKDNKGYAEGNNQGMARAKGKYVLLLNPDVILPAQGLEKAVAFMESHADCGALGVKQVHPDGRLQRSVRGFPSPLSILWELTGMSRLFTKSRAFGAYRMSWFDYASVCEVDQPMGTFLLIRQAVIEQVGMLDLSFPIFFNEVDWCLRCKRAGWKIYYTPDVEIIHYGGASTSQVGVAMAWESRRGLLSFYAKHYPAFWFLPLRAFIACASFPYAWLQARSRKR